MEDTSDIEGMPLGSRLNVKEIPGKGYGLVAATTIAKGTRILSEHPMFTIHTKEKTNQDLREAVSQAVSDLSDLQRGQFRSLHNAFEDDDPMFGRTGTNALPLGSASPDFGVFLLTSRINHACIQNTQHTWNEALEKMTVHAIRDIAEGEEITICYLSEHCNRAARQEELRSRFNFTCNCTLCSLPASERTESDKRRDEIVELDAFDPLLSDLESEELPDLLKCLHKAHRLLGLLEKEGIADVTVARVYLKAFKNTMEADEIPRAKIFAKRAADTRRLLEGKDSPAVQLMESYAENPDLYHKYPFGTEWRTTKFQVPEDLDQGAMERWLWKYATRIGAEYVDMRHQITFPTLYSLPGDGMFDTRYYGPDGVVNHDNPIRQWCLLAEIVDIRMSSRLRLVVRDKSDNIHAIDFHTETSGAELVPILRKGFTVAILYAEQYCFQDYTSGIYHENPATIKFFGFPLKTLLELSDKIQRQFAGAYGFRTCQVCNKRPAADLLSCAGCGMFWYCSTDCQTRGWNLHGHKTDCKRLEDPDLKAMFCMDWDAFGLSLEYPLTNP